MKYFNYNCELYKNTVFTYDVLIKIFLLFYVSCFLLSPSFSIMLYLRFYPVIKLKHAFQGIKIKRQEQHYLILRKKQVSY